MFSAMIKNKAIERLHRIEEISFPNMSESNRKSFEKHIKDQIDPKRNDTKMVSEDEINRILGNGSV